MERSVLIAVGGNSLIRAGHDIRIHEVGAGTMHGLGTPDDLDAFVRWNLSRAAERPRADG